MSKTLPTSLLSILLAACGGGGSSSSSDGSASSSPVLAAGSSIVLSGQVSDGPVQNAKVCLFSDGVQAKNADGSPICSSPTDSQGNYTLSIPSSLSSTALSLVASNGTDIKLVSSIGSSAAVAASADSSGAVKAAALPALKVSHFTTADFVLADTNNDGVVTAAELAAYVPDYSKSRTIAALIKAVIDNGQSASLASGSTPNTLLLASAAARNVPFGAQQQTVTQWVANPPNGTILASIDADALSDTPVFSNYLFSVFVGSVVTPPTSYTYNAAGKETGSISCNVTSPNTTAPVQVSLNKIRGLIAVKLNTRQIFGSYNPVTGAIRLNFDKPAEVSFVSNLGVTYYEEDHDSFTGSIDSQGKISGTYSEMTINTWTANTVRQVCTGTGTFTITKV